MFSLAPLPFSCRQLMYLNLEPLSMHRQVMAQFFHSMCSAVRTGRPGVSSPLPRAADLHLCADRRGRRGDEDEGDRWEGCAEWRLSSAVVELFNADRAVTFPQLQHLHVAGIQEDHESGEDPFIGEHVLGHWRSCIPHVQVVRLESQLDLLPEHRWLATWRRQNGFCDPRISVDCNSC